MKVVCKDKFGKEHLVEESELVETTRVYGVFIKENKILLVKDPRSGSKVWELPGGGVEEGETLEQAMIREFKEETGLDIVGEFELIDEFIETYFSLGGKAPWKADRKFYLIKDVKGEILENGNGWDTSVVSYIDIRDLGNIPLQENQQRPISKVITQIKIS